MEPLAFGTALKYFVVKGDVKVIFLERENIQGGVI